MRPSKSFACCFPFLAFLGPKGSLNNNAHMFWIPRAPNVGALRRAAGRWPWRSCCSGTRARAATDKAQGEMIAAQRLPFWGANLIGRDLETTQGPLDK